MKDSARIERSSKPRKYPNCDNSPLSDVVYGLVRMNDNLKRRIDEGVAVLGGCVITGDEPK